MRRTDEDDGVRVRVVKVRVVKVRVVETGWGESEHEHDTKKKKKKFITKRPQASNLLRLTLGGCPSPPSPPPPPKKGLPSPRGS